MENNQWQQQVYSNNNQGYSSQVPYSYNKWNWGAFMFNIAWGLGNKAYLTLLVLVPLLNIVWIFICGAQGNKWAWDSGAFKTVEQFEAAQETWNRAGKIMFFISLGILVLYLFIGVAACSAAISDL